MSSEQIPTTIPVEQTAASLETVSFNNRMKDLARRYPEGVVPTVEDYDAIVGIANDISFDESSESYFGPENERLNPALAKRTEKIASFDWRLSQDERLILSDALHKLTNTEKPPTFLQKIEALKDVGLDLEFETATELDARIADWQEQSMRAISLSDTLIARDEQIAKDTQSQQAKEKKLSDAELARKEIPELQNRIDSVNMPYSDFSIKDFMYFEGMAKHLTEIEVSGGEKQYEYRGQSVDTEFAKSVLEIASASTWVLSEEQRKSIKNALKARTFKDFDSVNFEHYAEFVDYQMDLNQALKNDDSVYDSLLPLWQAYLSRRLESSDRLNELLRTRVGGKLSLDFMTNFGIADPTLDGTLKIDGVVASIQREYDEDELSEFALAAGEMFDYQPKPVLDEPVKKRRVFKRKPKEAKPKARI